MIQIISHSKIQSTKKGKRVNLTTTNKISEQHSQIPKRFNGSNELQSKIWDVEMLTFQTSLYRNRKERQDRDYHTGQNTLPCDFHQHFRGNSIMLYLSKKVYFNCMKILPDLFGCAMKNSTRSWFHISHYFV